LLKCTQSGHPAADANVQHQPTRSALSGKHANQGKSPLMGGKWQRVARYVPIWCLPWQRATWNKNNFLSGKKWMNFNVENWIKRRDSIMLVFKEPGIFWIFVYLFITRPLSHSVRDIGYLSSILRKKCHFYFWEPTYGPTFILYFIPVRWLFIFISTTAVKFTLKICLIFFLLRPIFHGVWYLLLTENI
jgi:hypothetical protein